MPIFQFQNSFAIFFIIFPFSNILSFWRFEHSMSFFLISHPISIIIDVFIIIILSKAMLFTIHPLPVIYFLLFCLSSSWLSQEDTHAMIFILFKLTSILKILLIKIIHTISFNHFSSPSTNVHISVRKCILFFD